MHTYGETSRPHRGRAAARSSWHIRVLVAVCSLLLPSLGVAQLPSLSSERALARLQPLVAGHASLDARRANVAASEARSRAAGGVSPVALDAEIEETPRGFDVSRAGSIRVGLSREFLPGGRAAARRRLASADLARARLQLEMTERALASRVDQQLARTAASLRIAGRLAAEDSLFGAAEEALRARFATGDARYVDVLRLRSERLRAQSERAGAVSEARASRRALLGLLTAGDATGHVTSIVDSVLQAEVDALDSPLAVVPAADSLVRLAGELRVAAIDVSRAEAAQAIAKSEQRPSVLASIGAQRFEAEDGDRTLGATLGASITLPFTVRRANEAARAAASHDVAAARAHERAVASEVRAEIAAALDRYEAAREQLNLFDAALLRTAREEREGALASYRAGDLSLLELLDFERALARVEVDRLRNRISAADALAELVAGVSGIEHLSEGPEIERPGSVR